MRHTRECTLPELCCAEPLHLLLRGILCKGSSTDGPRQCCLMAHSRTAQVHLAAFAVYTVSLSAKLACARVTVSLQACLHSELNGLLCLLISPLCLGSPTAGCADQTPAARARCTGHNLLHQAQSVAAAQRISLSRFHDRRSAGAP